MRISIAMTAGLALTLGACGDGTETPSEPIAAGPVAEPSPDDTPEPVDLAEPSTITLTVTGLIIGGPKESTLKFGQDQDGAITAIKALLGSPEMGSNEECGAGPIQWAVFDGLQLNFQGGRLAGWSVDGAAGDVTIAGTNGLTIGAKKADVQRMPGYDAYEESTLGDEFNISSGGESVIVGLFGDDGRVTDLWTGAVCTFR